jgi:hypothetical protein
MAAFTAVIAFYHVPTVTTHVAALYVEFAVLQQRYSAAVTAPVDFDGQVAQVDVE